MTPYAVLTDSTALGTASKAPGTATVDGTISLVILDLPRFCRGRVLAEIDQRHRDLILDHPDGPGRGRFYMRQPFGGWELFCTFPDGDIWTVERSAPSVAAPEATVTVSRWDAEGSDLGVSPIGFEKIAIPAEMLAEALVGVAETGRPRLFSKPAFTVAQVRESVFLPDYLTPIDEVVSSESGEFILKQSGA